MARNTGSEAAMTTASPALVATVQVACPAATPNAVASPARRAPASVFRMVSAVSWPGVQMTSSETPRNARYDPSPITVKPLWRCPRCGRRFANRNQSHACAPVHRLADHFAGRDPEVVRTFRALVSAARRNGPVTVVPEKTRIALQVRMSFAAVSLKRHWLDVHVVLARRRESPRFTKVWTVSPRNQVHEFRLRSASEVDDEVADWLREAYSVGDQKHLVG